MTIFRHPMEKGAGEGQEFAGNLAPLSVFMFHVSHPSVRIRLCPNLHLLMTFRRQLPSSGHTTARFQ